MAYLGLILSAVGWVTSFYPMENDDMQSPLVRRCIGIALFIAGIFVILCNLP